MGVFYPDIPRICTALAEWSTCLVYTFFLKKRFTGIRYVIHCVAALALQILILVATANVPLRFWVPCMLLAVLCMFLFLRISCQITLSQTLYCCATAFMIAEFTASFEWQMYLYLLRWNWSVPGAEIFLPLFVDLGMFLAVFYLEGALLKNDFLSELSRWELVSTVGLVIMTFVFSNLNFLLSDQQCDSNVRFSIFEMRTLIDFTGIAILYAFQSRVSEYISKRETENIQRMLKSQYEQYRNYQENMEQLRIQRHDLKHHITLLRAESDARKREDWLDAMEQELNAGDVIDPTGNQVLDVILSAKKQIMKKGEVHFTCVADGALLNFMHVTDICTIFGNALDNAIESVLMVEDTEKRVIHLSLIQRNHFLFIQVRNFCEKEPVRKGKEFLTSKKEKQGHGYGLKSIRYSTEKYNGNITAEYKDSWFELGILIPIQQ